MFYINCNSALDSFQDITTTKESATLTSLISLAIAVLFVYIIVRFASFILDVLQSLLTIMLMIIIGLYVVYKNIPQYRNIIENFVKQFGSYTSFGDKKLERFMNVLNHYNNRQIQ